MVKVSGFPVRILFVDRNTELRDLYQELFALYGCNIESVRTGEEAIALVETYRPQAVYASLMLEGMNGLELATRLRKLDITRDVVLVALTGYLQQGIEAICRQAGFDFFLLKPTSIHNLILPLAGIPDLAANEAIRALAQDAKKSSEYRAYAAFRSSILGDN